MGAHLHAVEDLFGFLGRAPRHGNVDLDPFFFRPRTKAGVGPGDVDGESTRVVNEEFLSNDRYRLARRSRVGHAESGESKWEITWVIYRSVKRLVKTAFPRIGARAFGFLRRS
jgi:hypothetical protein